MHSYRIDQGELRECVWKTKGEEKCTIIILASSLSYVRKYRLACVGSCSSTTKYQRRKLAISMFDKAAIDRSDNS